MLISWIIVLYFSLSSAASFNRKRGRTEIEGSECQNARQSFIEIFGDVPKPERNSADDDPAMLLSMISLRRSSSVPREPSDVKRQFEEALYVRNYARLDELISYGAIPADVAISLLEGILASNDHVSLYMLYRLLDNVPEVARNIAHRNSRFANIIASNNGPNCEKLLLWLDRWTNFVENEPETMAPVVMELVTHNRYEFVRHALGTLDYSQTMSLVENCCLHLSSLGLWCSLIQLYQFLRFNHFRLSGEIISSALTAAYAIKSYQVTEDILSHHAEVIPDMPVLPFARIDLPEFDPEIVQLYHSVCEAFGEQGLFEYSYSLAFGEK